VYLSGFESVDFKINIHVIISLHFVKFTVKMLRNYI